MDKLNKTIIWMIGIILVLLTILSVLIIYKQEPKMESKEKEETKIAEVILDECTDEYDNIEVEDIKETTSKDEKISPNCKITLIKNYKECKDSINEYIQVPDNLVNCTKEELQNMYKDWEIKEFSSNKISLYKEIEGSCGEHYILKNENGKISIYKLSETGKETLYEKTDISIDYLPEKDKVSIEDGIKINGKEKLNELIESFE